MDRISIIAPDSLHDFLFTLPAIQAYQIATVMGAVHGDRDKFYEVTIRIHDKFEYFFPCLQVLKECVPVIDHTGWLVQDRSEYECFIDFDLKRAAKVALPTKRHITDGIGICIGASVQKWPILQALQLPKPDAFKILVVDFGKGTQKFINYIACNLPEKVDCDWVESAAPTDGNYKDWVEGINSYSAVIGNASDATYLAASLKKSVIEFFPNDEQAVLYNNLGLANYQSGVGIPDPALAFALWSDMIDKLGDINAAKIPPDVRQARSTEASQ